MPATSARRPLLLVAVVSLGVIAWSLGETGRGAPPARQDDVPAPGHEEARGPRPDLVKRYNPAGTCVRCHNIAEGAPNPPPETPQYQLPPLVKLNEFRTWRDQDKHQGAYVALRADRGQRMGKLLGIDVTTHGACLACHAPGGVIDVAGRKEGELEERKMEGVSCVSCHGPYDAWVQNHWDVNSRWRDKRMVEKERDFGLAPLRDPAERTRVCLSCHLGNADEGKVLTHEMYAAGHPPLPGFETASFSLAEPPHWWQPREVPAFEKAPDQLLQNFNVDLSGLHHTKMVLLGSVVALREAMELIAAQARPGAGGQEWPDYAVFECYACHHDLKSPGYRQWRQVRGYPGQPGRPQFRPWPTALVWLSTQQAGTNEFAALQNQYATAMGSLYRTVDLQVFGAAPDVVRDAGNLARWADGLVAKVDVSHLNQKTLPGLLRDLVTLPPNAYPDYETARQIAWAFDVIYSEWDPKPANAGRIEAALDRLRQDLKLDPFQSRDLWDQATGDHQAHYQQSESELLRSLIRAAEYDPDTFKATLRSLLPLLPAR
jgi:hypothetical protein